MLCAPLVDTLRYHVSDSKKSDNEKRYHNEKILLSTLHMFS